MRIPLAEKVRPRCIDDVVGQGNLLAKNKPLRNIVEGGRVINMIFYGPPGTGKTTVAKIAAKNSKMDFKILNCTALTSCDIKDILSSSENPSFSNGIVLYLDEIQYLNKKQQQTLLESMENGSITLIGSTTENPNFSIYNAILSRCVLFEFFPVSAKDIVKVIKKSLPILEAEVGQKISCSENIMEKIGYFSGGDVRKAVNLLEACAFSLLGGENIRQDSVLSEEVLNNICQKCVYYSDKSGDGHYELLSAFQKSMRGSDVDAALYYLCLLLQGGEILSVCRRMQVCACEDVGLAYPQIISIVKSCADIALSLGMPEARIPLADAVTLICLSPKSNSAYQAINSVFADVESGTVDPVPLHLQNNPVNPENRNIKYLYPHDFPNHWVRQDYMPKALLWKTYYSPGDNKNERAFCEYWRKIKDGNPKK